MKKYILSIALVFGVTISSFAQNPLQSITFTYNPGFAFGDLKDFADNSSWRGYGLDYRYLVANNTDVGLYLGWNGFYEKRDKQEYVQGNTTLYANTWRYFYTIPIYAQVHQYFGEGPLTGYLGAGAGVSYVDQELDIADISIYDTYWKFGFAVDGGIRYNLPNSGVGFQLGVKYNYIVYNEFDMGNVNYLNANIGIVLNLD